jgi:DNA-binding CsgD family transcriptional regulator
MFVSNSTQRILGYPAQNFIEEGLDFIASRIHPEDYPIALAVSAKMHGKKKDFPKRIELRIKNNKGKWVWTEIDFVVPNDINARVSQIFGVMKDISAEKEKCLEDKVGQAIKFSINSTYISAENYDLESQFDNSIKSNAYKKVTRREKEVLKLVADGFSAKEVANKLSISIHTAINHRKNLITKFHVKNTAELIKVASKNFWL